MGELLHFARRGPRQRRRYLRAVLRQVLLSLEKPQPDERDLEMARRAARVALDLVGDPE